MPTMLNPDENDYELVLPERPNVRVPAELMTALAVGLDDPDVIAGRYISRVPTAAWDKLKTYPPFVKEVERQRAELIATGYTFRIKAKQLTEDVFDEAYKSAKHEDTTLMQKLEFIKLGAKLADMEPKASTNPNNPTFSINITLPTTTLPPAPTIINP